MHPFVKHLIRGHVLPAPFALTPRHRFAPTFTSMLLPRCFCARYRQKRRAKGEEVAAIRGTLFCRKMNDFAMIPGELRRLNLENCLMARHTKARFDTINILGIMNFLGECL